MNRIQPQDDVASVITKMSEGNIGCVNFLLKLLDGSELVEVLRGIEQISMLDALELYGDKAYMLWNDCCGRDIKSVELVLKNWQMGKLSKEEIHENLNQSYGTPFENLVPFTE